MWGQGLNRNDRFARRITRALPALLGKRSAVISADASRSGAKIRARGDDRATFVDRFPSLFTSPRQRGAFLQSRDESPATGLYGEIPAPCPTVRGQVDLVSAALGRTIDVALVDGGVNDIDVEDIINPDVSAGEFIERWDGQIRAVAHDDVLDLLGRVRRKCPKAVIIYFGFFAPASYESSPSKIRAAFKHEYDNDFFWWLNGLIGFRDINNMIHEAMVRSVWMQGRYQYWARQAVVDANRSTEMRGPGILFVPSGFRGGNSLFTRRPFLHEDYIDPTVDPARTERLRRCPRADQLRNMRSVHATASSLSADPTSRSRIPLPRSARALNDAIDGPLRLKEALQNVVDQSARRRGRTTTTTTTTQRRGDASPEQLLLEPLQNEIERIQHALIASMSHPNAAGARSYADNAIERLTRHLQVTEAIERAARPGSPPAGLGGETLDDQLTRYRLRTAGPIGADVGHLDVDSLALRVVTAANSDQNFFANIWLYVTTNANYGRGGSREYLVNFLYRQERNWFHKYYPHFEPGQTNRFTIDTMDGLRLDEIVGCHLVVGIDPLRGQRAPRRYGRSWRPATVRLEINGVEVVNLDLAGQRFGFGYTLDLSYPAPEPNFVPPRRAPITIKRVRPLAGRAASRSTS